MFPTKWDALQRNYAKYFLGAIGGYLLGISGWFLFIAIGCLIDLKIGPEYKFDLRQRLSEVPFKTACLVERPKVPIGKIAVDGGRWARMKEKEEKARKYAKRLKREERAATKKAHMEERSEKRKEKIKDSIKKTSLKTDEILSSETKAPRSRGGLGIKLGEKKEKPRKTSVLMAVEKKEEEDLDIELDDIEPKKEKKPLFETTEKKEKPARSLSLEMEGEEELPKEKKVPFWKKLFGGGKKEEETTDEKVEETSKTPAPAIKKDASKDETLLQFMFDFDLDEKRAHGLYDMGYRKKEDLKDAIPQDLMMIEGFNPTIAKRVLKITNQ
jgi:hypothetical protein